MSLDEPATGRRIWSQQFSGMKQDLLTLQDQIYSGLLTALIVKLSNEEMAKSTAHLTENIGAYALYLKGAAAQIRPARRENSEAGAGSVRGRYHERSKLHARLHRNRRYWAVSLQT